MQPPLLSILLCILLIGGQAGPSLAQQTDSLDPRKSLFVTEFSQLTPFRFDRVLSALLRDTPDTTSLMLFHQWIDNQNPAPGLGSDEAGPFCNDELTAGVATRNSIVILCPSTNGNLAMVNPICRLPRSAARRRFPVTRCVRPRRAGQSLRRCPSGRRELR